MPRLALVLLLLSGSGGCGSDTNTAAKARADCEAYITSHFCPKVTSCVSTITQAECVASIHAGLNCDMATSENGELATCESQLAATPCTVLAPGDGSINTPASCKGVFLTQ